MSVTLTQTADILLVYTWSRREPLSVVGSVTCWRNPRSSIRLMIVCWEFWQMSTLKSPVSPPADLLGDILPTSPSMTVAMALGLFEVDKLWPCWWGQYPSSVSQRHAQESALEAAVVLDCTPSETRPWLHRISPL